MKSKSSTFQIILYVVLVLAIIVGVLLFSIRRTNSNQGASPVTMWGTLPEQIIRELTEAINLAERDSVNITYTEFSETNFEENLVEALAAGNGPDMVLMKDDLLLRHENKLYTIGYDFYPQKTFKETFVESGDVLLKEDGITGLPYLIDPMVMYWNRSLLNSSGISNPPKTWNEFTQLIPRIVQKDATFNISKAAISMGEFRNIKNAKEILIGLIMQAGNPIVSRNFDGDPESVGYQPFVLTFNERLGFSAKPAEAAVSFFTQFSNPNKEIYSWNRALPNSEEMFLAGDLAFYFGFASEYTNLQRKNPNLNFDVTMIPQSQTENGVKKTYGDMVFVGLVKSSPNLSGAFDAAVKITNADNIQMISDLMNLPPVRRDLLVDQHSNSALQVFGDSALVAQPFVDPNDIKTDKILSDMIESFVSGRSSMSEVLLRAESQMQELLK